MIATREFARRVSRLDIYKVRTIPRLVKLHIHCIRAQVYIRIIVNLQRAAGFLDNINLAVLVHKVEVLIALLPFAELKRCGGSGRLTLVL